MQKLKTVISATTAGRFACYIPVILRQACGLEMERIPHSVPPEHAGHLEKMYQMLLDAAKASVEQADLVIIPGGADIKPVFYGQAPSEYTDETPALSYRDEVEALMIHTALEWDIPIIHICRGHQLGLLLMSKNADPALLQFSQHLPEVTSATHRADFFLSGKELIFNARYIHGDLSEDLAIGRKSPIVHEQNLVHKICVFPGTITHCLYKRALGLPSSYDEPLEIEETSHHHQGFIVNSELKMPDNLVCSALSVAGDEIPVLEGFERTDKSMCIGVQWHLEANASGKAGKLFKDITDYAWFKKQNHSVSFFEWVETQEGRV